MTFKFNIDDEYKFEHGGTLFFGAVSCPVVECAKSESPTQYQHLQNFSYTPVMKTIYKNSYESEGEKLVMFFEGECGHRWELVFEEDEGRLAVGIANVRKHDD